MSKYVGSEQWREDVTRARENWRGGTATWPFTPGKVEERWIPTHDEDADPLRDESIRVIEASADTGSRYSVVVTPLPPVSRGILGASHLVSVVSPWQAAYPMQVHGELHSNYVAEKLCGDRLLSERLYGGDLAALTLTVAYALGRQPVLD